MINKISSRDHFLRQDESPHRNSEHTGEKKESNRPQTLGRHALPYQDERQSKHSHRLKSAFKRNPLLFIGCVLLVISAIVGTLPFILMLANTGVQQAADAQHDEKALEISAAIREKQWQKAERYNERLYKSGQPVLGKEVDPFTASAEEQTREVQDYKSQLNSTGDGVMSVIRYPRLSINLPVEHGTDESTLQRGAGHLYGTSLPVGGKNTRVVIAAHSGLTNKIMFDRLDGLGSRARVGDIFYLTTLGRELAYKVVNIQVIDPGDFSTLRIVRGKDLATLLTCTPYGVNSRRLLVTGKRVSIPMKPAAWPLTWLWWLLGILAVLGLAIAAAVRSWRMGFGSTARKAGLHVRRR